MPTVRKWWSVGEPGGLLPTLMLFAAGLHSSRTQRLWEPVPGADWKHIRIYRHTRSPHHHQLPARSAVQVQLQLPTGIPGQQHTAGLVSLSATFKWVYSALVGVLQKAIH